MLPKLEKLKAKADELGLAVKAAGKKLGKDDYVRELRAHFMPEGGLPYEETTPMLCFAEWNLKPEEAKKAWTSESWGAQRKLNGCRLVLHFVEGVGVFAHSRTISVKTFRYQELTDQLLIASFKPSFSATVDCEVLVEKSIDTRPYTAKGEITKTSLHSATALLHLEAENSKKLQIDQDARLQFHCFDIMKWNGRDLKQLSLNRRVQILAEFRQAIAGTEIVGDFHFPEIVLTGKKEFLAKVLSDGGEGVILKRMESKYEDSSSRPRDSWVKVKRRMDFDAYVSGFKRGDVGTAWENLIGAIEFSVNTEQGPHVLGYATNITLENRRRLTVYDTATNTVSLLPALYGKVAEISGQDVSAREQRLSHCTIERWRPKDGPDAKRKHECNYKMSDLLASSEWVGS